MILAATAYPAVTSASLGTVDHSPIPGGSGIGSGQNACGLAKATDPPKSHVTGSRIWSLGPNTSPQPFNSSSCCRQGSCQYLQIKVEQLQIQITQLNSRNTAFIPYKQRAYNKSGQSRVFQLPKKWHYARKCPEKKGSPSLRFHHFNAGKLLLHPNPRPFQAQHGWETRTLRTMVLWLKNWPCK